MPVSDVHSAHALSLHPVTTAVMSTDQQDRPHNARTGGLDGGVVRVWSEDYQLNAITAGSTIMLSRAEHGCVGLSSDSVCVGPSVSGARLGAIQPAILGEREILVREHDRVIVTTAVEPLLSECSFSPTWEQGGLTLLG